MIDDNSSMDTMFKDSSRGRRLPNSGHEATTGAGDTNREAMVISGEFERLCKPTVCMTLREGGIEQSAPSGKRTELDSDRHVF